MKKGQAWGADLIIGTSLFITAIAILYIYTYNDAARTHDPLSSLYDQAAVVSEALMSEGEPLDWNEGNVIRIGILENNSMSEEKLASLNALAATDYKTTKQLFRIQNNYDIQFSESLNVNGEEITHIGLSPENPKNLVKVTRLATYKNSFITIEVLIWE